MPSDGLVHRKTTIITLQDVINDVDLLRPENVRLKLSRYKTPIDIGSLCFKIRQLRHNLGANGSAPLKVNVSSLLVERRNLIVNMLDSFVLGSYTDATINSKIKDARDCLKWCDENGYSNVFESPEKARFAYIAYSEYLRDVIRQKQGRSINPRTAKCLQLGMKRILSLVFPDDILDISRMVHTIRGSVSTKLPPAQSKVEFMRDVHIAIFEHYTEQVLSGNSFPWRLELPNQGKAKYVFPFTTGNAAPFKSSYGGKLPPTHDYENGTVRDKAQYIEFCRKEKRKYSNPLARTRKAKEQLASANNDLRHRARVQFASLAVASFIQLFLLSTGANAGTVRELKWEDFQTEQTLASNMFTAIKPRAKGKEVSYILGARMRNLFKRYLKLRSWLLNGQKFDYLFFNMDKHHRKVKRLNKDFVGSYYNRLRGLYIPESTENLTTQDYRLFKVGELYRAGENSSDIADSLQHSEKTSEQVYARGDIELQQGEFHNFWSAADRIKVLFLDNDDVHTTSTPSGQCGSLGTPEPVNAAPPITPDCSVPQGCLFCSHYAIHADDKDIRKILSVLYVVTELHSKLAHVRDVDGLYGHLINRIRDLLERVTAFSSDCKNMVSKLKDEVLEHGLLTPYWDRVVQRYEALGIL